MPVPLLTAPQLRLLVPLLFLRLLQLPLRVMVEPHSEQLGAS